MKYNENTRIDWNEITKILTDNVCNEGILIDTDKATKILQTDIKKFLVTRFHTKIFDAKYRNKDKYSKEDLTNLSKTALEYQKRTKV